MNEIATRQADDSRVSPPLWLDRCKLSHPVPVPKEEAQDELAKARRALYESTPIEVGQKLDRVLAHYDLPGNWAARVDDYIKSLCKLPPDLLDRALQHVLETYPYKFPKIADIMKVVEQDITERKAVLAKLETVVKHGKFPDPDYRPATAEEKAKATALVDNLFKSWGIERK